MKGKETNVVTSDFDGITGNDLIEAERTLCAMGDTSPSAYLSMRYYAIIAAKLPGVPRDERHRIQECDRGGGWFLLTQASYTPIPFFLTLSLGELAEYVEMASKKPR